MSMRPDDIISRSIDSLWRAKSRTLLTMAAIGVGAFSLTLAVGLDIGGGHYTDQIISANADKQSLWVTRLQDDQATSVRPSEFTGSPFLRFNNIAVQPLDDDDIAKIGTVQGVGSVTPFFMLDSAYITRSGEKDYQAVISALRPGMKVDYIAGSGDNLGDSDIILPEGYVDALDFSSPEAAIGSTVTVHMVNTVTQKPVKKIMSYVVRAVSRQSKLSLGNAASSVLVTKASAEELNHFMTDGSLMQDKYVAASVRVNAGGDIQTVKQHIHNLGYLAQTPTDVNGALYQFTGVLQTVLFGFGILAVITAVFGIVNTQYISVLERVQEIGLMKALGMSKIGVSRLFRIEAGLIGLFGGVLGTLLAIALGSLLNPLFVQMIDLDKGTNLIDFTWYSTAGIIVGLFLVSLLAGVSPARRASRLDPIEALRNDQL